jgi:hypothetical protein
MASALHHNNDNPTVKEKSVFRPNKLHAADRPKLVQQFQALFDS